MFVCFTAYNTETSLKLLSFIKLKSCYNLTLTKGGPKYVVYLVCMMVIVECMLTLSHGCFSMSSSKSASHVVVAWKNKGGEAFENELVEAISMKKLIFKGSAQVGTEVSMPYKNDLWMGTILSVHGKFCNLAQSQKLKYSETGYSAQFLYRF